MDVLYAQMQQGKKYDDSLLLVPGNIEEDRKVCAKTPAGRWGTPEDMVGPCVFLASHASDFVNGQILYADGGILAYIGKQPK